MKTQKCRRRDKRRRRLRRRLRRRRRSVDCAVCGRYAGVPPGNYPGYVCKKCDARAVNKHGRRPFHVEDDWGENPVYIDGIKCVRHYKFGGWVTMRLDAGGFLPEEILDY